VYTGTSLYVCIWLYFLITFTLTAQHSDPDLALNGFRLMVKTVLFYWCLLFWRCCSAPLLWHIPVNWCVLRCLFFINTNIAERWTSYRLAFKLCSLCFTVPYHLIVSPDFIVLCKKLLTHWPPNSVLCLCCGFFFVTVITRMSLL